MTCHARVNVGEPAPWFASPTSLDQGKSILLDELAGRPIVLLFTGQGAVPEIANVLAVFSELGCLMMRVAF
jgi:hypothetical protein